MLENKANNVTVTEEQMKDTEMAIIIDVMQKIRGFDSSLCPLLLQYMEEDQKEGEDMLVAVSYAASENGYKDISEEEFEWLKQFKLRKGDETSYRCIALCIYKDGAIDKDVLSFAYRHSRTQKEFSTLAAKIQALINS